MKRTALALLVIAAILLVSTAVSAEQQSCTDYDLGNGTMHRCYARTEPGSENGAVTQHTSGFVTYDSGNGIETVAYRVNTVNKGESQVDISVSKSVYTDGTTFHCVKKDDVFVNNC